MPTDHKGYAEHLALRKPSNPAFVRVIMTLARAGVLEAIEKAPSGTQVGLLEDAIKGIVAGLESKEKG